jgi:CoxE family protein
MNIIFRKILKIVRYLNKSGYSITNSDIIRFFNFFKDSHNLNFINKDEVYTAMEITFAKTKHEQLNLKFLVDKFLSDDEELEELYKKKSNSTKRYNNFMEKINQESGNGNSEDNEDSDDKLQKTLDKIFKKHDFKPGKYDVENEKIKDLLEQGTAESLKEINNKDLNQELKEIAKKSEKSLMENKIEDFLLQQQLFNVLEEIQDKLLKEKKKQSIDGDSIQKKTENYNKKQKELNRKINDLIHQKNNSSIDLLINKKENTVDDSNNPLMNENLSEIMNEPSIYEYLKSNLNLFKTKFSRIIKTSEKNKINIQETILSACKTRGIPLELKYDKPKISKTNLVLVLDISGSCIGASKIMLSMMYYLKELFPGGVTTYVFVDKLYDVSDVMKSNNINEAFNIIQKTVPSINHWSNYYEPLKELWIKHSNKFRNDTFVLFIGDARNNRYESGEKYFKNIVSKSKKVWWLNTESQWYWNTGDSIAYIYNKYCKMFEVETLRDLIRFIERAK